MIILNSWSCPFKTRDVQFNLQHVFCTRSMMMSGWSERQVQISPLGTDELKTSSDNQTCFTFSEWLRKLSTRKGLSRGCITVTKTFLVEMHGNATMLRMLRTLQKVQTFVFLQFPEPKSSYFVSFPLLSSQRLSVPLSSSRALGFQLLSRVPSSNATESELLSMKLTDSFHSIIHCFLSCRKTQSIQHQILLVEVWFMPDP